MASTMISPENFEGLGSLSDTMLKLRADQERNQQGVPLLTPKSWVYVEGRPSSPKMESSGTRTSSLVQVTVGPVIGVVTESSATIMLEIDISAAVTLVLARRDAPQEEVPRRLQRRLPANTPKVFYVEGLEPGSAYDVSFEGLADCELEDVACTIRTLPPPDQVRSITVAAVSCNRPAEMDAEPEENLFNRMLVGEAQLPESPEEPLVFLHLGAQVHTQMNRYLQQACRCMEDYDRAPPNLAAKMKERAFEKLQCAYRDTWSEDEIKAVLAKGQHMLMWSDSDVAVDFTTLKNASGQQAYHPEFLRCAMKCYRKYQRQLWDPTGEGELPERGYPVEEFQFRRFGGLGVFLIDMRGNRITSQGQVVDGAPIMSERQRQTFVAALASPGMTGLIVASELPFITDSPGDIRKKADGDKEQTAPYLREQWTYNIEELTWLLESIFDWRAEAPEVREVLLLGGGIAAGVESTITDRKTGVTVRQMVTSPITDIPKNFNAELKGDVNERFSYTHKPLLQQRNYCQINVSFGDDGACKIAAQLECSQAMDMSKKDKVPVQIKKKTVRSAGLTRPIS